MVDAADLKSVSSNGVRVQVPPRALFCNSLQRQVNKGTWVFCDIQINLLYQKLGVASICIIRNIWASKVTAKITPIDR